MRSTYGRLAPGAEAGILATQGAANNWSTGAMAGRNPGSPTYGAMMAANDPTIGLLSGMTGERQTGDYSGFGGSNPAMERMRALSAGYTPQGDYSGFGGVNPAFARASALGDGGFVGQGDAADYFRDVMGGRTNEAFSEVLRNTLDDVSTRVNSRFGAAGVGFGNSTDHSGLLARELGRTSAEMRAANFEADQARRMQAAMGLDGATRGDRAQQLQALGLTGDMYSTGEAQRLAASQARDVAGLSAFDSALRATGLLSDAYGRDEALRLNATQAGDQARNAEFAQRMQATGLLGDAWSRQNGIQMAGAQAADQAYGADIDRQMQAWATAQDLMRGSQGLLGNAAELPWTGIRAQSGGTSGLTSGYGTTTSRTSGGLLGDIAGIGLMGASVAGGLGWSPFGKGG